MKSLQSLAPHNRKRAEEKRRRGATAAGFGEAGQTASEINLPEASLLVIDSSLWTQESLCCALKPRMPELSVTGAPHSSSAPSCADIVLINIGGRSVGGDATRKEIASARSCFPDARFVVLSEISDSDATSAAIDSGMHAYVPASLSLDMLVAVIRLVLVGGMYFPAEAVAALAHNRQSESFQQAVTVPPKAEDSKQLFTEREKEVLLGLQKGKPNKIIAHELNIASSTVKVHIRNIMKKLNATNRTQAVLRAAEPAFYASH